MDNPLWEYSLAVYQADGVAPACLRLQDDFGLDVNLLLYAGWLAEAGERMSDKHLRGLESEIADWRDNVVRPLRALRRQWRDFPDAADLRQALKSLELRAEQHQQGLMYSYYQRAPSLPREPGSVASNLALVARFSYPQKRDWEAPISSLAGLLAR